MANIKQQEEAAARRLVILKLLRRAKAPATTAYLAAMLASPWWEGAAKRGRRTGATYDKSPQDVARDLTNLARDGLTEKIQFLHWIDDDESKGFVVQRMAAWRLTVAGNVAAKGCAP